MYWASIVEMKALVEPFPLVPAMCIRFRRSKSLGYHAAQPSSTQTECSKSSHLIANPANPLLHLRDSQKIHVLPVFSYSLDDGEVALQAVESCDGALNAAVRRVL